MWQPFLLGCGVCGAVAGFVGWIVLDRIWRWRVRQKYRTRGGRTEPWDERKPPDSRLS